MTEELIKLRECVKDCINTLHKIYEDSEEARKIIDEFHKNEDLRLTVNELSGYADLLETLASALKNKSLMKDAIEIRYRIGKI